MGNKEIRQWEYEHGERKLPEAPWWLGNWSLTGLLYRLTRRHDDRLLDASRRMRDDRENPR